MTTYSFQTVPKLHGEWSGALRLAELLPGVSAVKRLLLVTDEGLVRAGVVGRMVDRLTEAGYATAVFTEVLPDPPEEIVLRCVEAGRLANAEAVLGLGGGSSLDVAKVVAVLLATDQPLSAMYGINKVSGSRLPLILVPTTAGTGSEVTNISILTVGGFTKMGIVAPQLYADFVLLDAELTVSLPALHTAATGIDAMVHAIEAYTSRYKKNPISDHLAREALRLLSSNLITACREGSNRSAREAMLLGAMLAGQAFANAPVAAVHALAYPLGGHFHIPHGLSNALMLGPVLRFNRTAAEDLYAELAGSVGVTGSSNAERCEAFLRRMEELMDASGAPRRLRDVQVPESSLSVLATDAMKQTRLLINNPVDVSESDALRLYQEAY